MSLTNPNVLLDTTFSNKNISSAASVYDYTVLSNGKINISVKLTNAAGNGDYIVYLKRQWEGTGTASVLLPKTTATAASGETVIEFQTIMILVEATDVISVFISGLAGDTAVNGNIVIFQDNYSTIETSDNVGVNWANVAGKTTANDLTNTTIATGNIDNDVWSYATREITGGGGSASDIWAYPTRTLTQSASAASTAIKGSTLTITNRVTYSATISGLTIPATWTKVYFTSKTIKTIEDSVSTLQIVVSNPAAGSTDGILYIGGAAAGSNRTKGSITVNQSSGYVTIDISDDLDLSSYVATSYYGYDIKALKADGTSVLLAGSGKMLIENTETKTV